MFADVVFPNYASGSPEVRLSHGGQELFFSVSCFGKNSFQNEFSVFDHLNQLWASYPASKQDEIFKLYSDISFLFASSVDRTSMVVSITDKVTQLMSHHEFDDIYQWVLFTSDIAIPSNFDVDYVHSVDKQGSREQTYIRSDYTKLIALAIAMRVMIPIWGQFISYTRAETGNLYKEYYAFSLLNKSKILTSEPYEKLMVYIDRTVGDDRVNPSTVTEGINSEIFTEWMMALVVLRRLCVGDIRGMDPRANMVTFIHRYIGSKLNGSDISAGDAIKPKTYDEGGVDMESKLSTLERYKVKHTISLGEIVELEHSMKDMWGIANQLTGNMSRELFDRSMASARTLMSHRLLDPQIMLLCYVMKPVISPKGLMYLSKEILVQAIGVAQAVLWARGHHYLALLASSHINMNADVMFASNTDSRQRIPKEMLAELDELYPYMKIVGGRKTGQKPINLAVRSIETIADNLSLFTWTMTADEGFIQDFFGHCNTRRITITPDIKIKLAKFVIEIGRRNWV